MQLGRLCLHFSGVIAPTCQILTYMMEKQETEPRLLATASSSWRKAVPIVRSHHPLPSQHHHRHPLHDKKKKGKTTTIY